MLEVLLARSIVFLTGDLGEGVADVLPVQQTQQIRKFSIFATNKCMIDKVTAIVNDVHVIHSK